MFVCLFVSLFFLAREKGQERHPTVVFSFFLTGGVGIIGGGDSATAAAKWNMEDHCFRMSRVLTSCYVLTNWLWLL